MLKDGCLAQETKETQIAGEKEVLSAKMIELEHLLADSRKQDQITQAKARELGNALGEVHGRLKAEQERLNQIEHDVLTVTSQISDASRRGQEYAVEEANVEAEVAAAQPEQEVELQQEAAQLGERYRQLDETRKQGRDRLGECAESVQRARAELDHLRERLSGLQLEKQKLELERENLRERIETEYGCEVYAELQGCDQQSASILPDERARRHEEVSRLKARVLREGDVDPESIQRLEEEQSRLSNLVQQKKDLEEASLTLKRTIEKLTETSLRRFTETFEAVRANFSKLVPRLFGGGRGSLELTDLANPLESGLEIIARPPGKKLRSIELLSGGEKALCAAALIFAMFLERSSPLCILDEVDAPLDDASLMRFLGLVKELSAKTQFIVITHNKQSMGVCDNLIGVTMEEPGASKVLSVSLQEACSRVA